MSFRLSLYGFRKKKMQDIYKGEMESAWNYCQHALIVAEAYQASKRFSNAKRAFVGDAIIVKVYAVLKWPRMFLNV